MTSLPATAYVPRLLEARLSELFAQLPALLVVGPRAAGKTTMAARHARTIVRLDREAEAAAFRADADAALAAQPTPVLLDEWQAVAPVLGAVKRAVDADPRPGRFILTGSVRAELEGETWPGTGRLVRLRLYGVAMREVARASSAPFIDRLAGGRLEQFGLPADVPDLRGYLDLLLRSGFPEALLHLSGGAREAWLDGYLEQLLTRDAPQLGAVRDPARVRRYFEAIALSTAGMPDDRTLFTAAGIDHRTARSYERLLTDLFAVDALPAWQTNRLSRLVRSAKRYVVEPALAASVLRLDASAILRDGDLLGRMLDTFVVAQLRAELDVSSRRPRLYHLREKNGRREVDVLAEMGQDVIGIEVKASASPRVEDAGHLVHMRERLGARFLAGAVLHTGPASFNLSERIFALPICSIWG